MRGSKKSHILGESISIQMFREAHSRESEKTVLGSCWVMNMGCYHFLHPLSVHGGASKCSWTSYPTPSSVAQLSHLPTKQLLVTSP